VTNAARPAPVWTGLIIASLACAIVGLFVWPFVFESLAGLLVLIAAKQTADPRYTRPLILVVTTCAVLGASFAVVFNHALY
jgi:hypothetical protein